MAKAESPVGLESAENPRSWAELPTDLLCEVFSRIFAGDRAVFSSVCKTWNSVSSLMTNQQFRRLAPVNSDCFSPFLMHSKNKLFHPIYGGLYQFDSPNMKGTTIRATRDDWILMIEHCDELFFLNPFTKEEVRLPHDGYSGQYCSVYFSSAPTLPDCLVVAVGMYAGSITICYRKVGDFEWTIHEVLDEVNINSFEFSFCNPVVCNGLYYFLGIDGGLLVYNPENDKLYFEEAPEYISMLMASGGDIYMLESDGNIIAVFVSDDGKSLYILQWNVLKKRWETVESLGNRMLFVSRPLSFCVESTIKGTSNKIYFPRSVNDHILFYSLSTKRYHTFALGTTYQDFYGSKGVPKCVGWIRKQCEPIIYLNYQSDDKLYAATKLGKKKDLQTEKLLSEKTGDWQELTISRSPLLRQPHTSLMILDGVNGKRPSFYSITDDHYYIPNVPELENKYVEVCYEGLLVLKDKCTQELCILNILSMEKRQLPELSINRNVDLYAFVFSSPKMDRSCRIVFFSYGTNLRSCYLGDNEFVERNVGGDDDLLIYRAINFDGKLFALAGDLDLLMADFLDPELNFTRVVSGESIVDLSFPHTECIQYLVGAGGEILLISVITNDGEVSDVTIFKAVFSSGEWETVNTIGDMAIFLGKHNAYPSPASAFGLKGNAIYWKRRRNLYMYDLEDESISMHLAFPIHETNSTLCWLSLPFNEG